LRVSTHANNGAATHELAERAEAELAKNAQEKARRVSFTHAEVCLTASCFMILLSIMKTKTATVADLRNNFRRVSAWLENGESVEIVKRGRRFARLVPAAATSLDMLIKVDFAAQLSAVWGQKVFSDSEIEAMREAELGAKS